MFSLLTLCSPSNDHCESSWIYFLFEAIGALQKFDLCWWMSSLAEDHCDSVGFLGYCWDRERREFTVQVPKTGNTLYRPLSFPFFQPSKVKFRGIIIRNWSFKVCLRIWRMRGRKALLWQLKVLWTWWDLVLLWGSNWRNCGSEEYGSIVRPSDSNFSSSTYAASSWNKLLNSFVSHSHHL